MSASNPVLSDDGKFVVVHGARLGFSTVSGSVQDCVVLEYDEVFYVPAGNYFGILITDEQSILYMFTLDGRSFSEHLLSANSTKQVARLTLQADEIIWFRVMPATVTEQVGNDTGGSVLPDEQVSVAIMVR